MLIEYLIVTQLPLLDKDILLTISSIFQLKGAFIGFYVRT
jgi:hypothetical protein